MSVAPAQTTPDVQQLLENLKLSPYWPTVEKLRATEPVFALVRDSAPEAPAIGLMTFKDGRAAHYFMLSVGQRIIIDWTKQRLVDKKPPAIFHIIHVF